MVSLTSFADDLQPVLALMSGLLGLREFERVSKECIALLWLMSQPGFVLDIPTFLASAIQTQFQEISSSMAFHFYSLLFYPFLFKHADMFEALGLEKLSRMNGQPRTVFEWKILVRQQPNGRGYSRFLNKFMTIAYTILHDSPPPRIFPEQKD